MNTAVKIATGNSLPVAPSDQKDAPLGGLSSRLGNFAYKHQAFFKSRTGDLMFHNAAVSMAAWVPTIASFLVTRATWEKYESYAAKHAESLLTKVGKPFLSKEYPVGRTIGFIFFGWGTYRTATKLMHRAYDRLFAAKDAAAATQIVHDTPGNALKDLKEILPGAVAEVAVGSFVLGGVKAAFVNPKTIGVVKGDWKMAKKGFVNDWLATSVGYSAFTDVTERIYRSVSGGKDSPEYYRKLKGLPPEVPVVAPEHKKFGAFTNDGLGRMVFRTAGSVTLGFAAYFAAQRGAKAAFGVPTNIESTLKGITKNYAVDYAAWAAPFTLYTLISQVYKEGYDKLFNTLEKHYATQNHSRSKQ